VTQKRSPHSSSDKGTSNGGTNRYCIEHDNSLTDNERNTQIAGKENIKTWNANYDKVNKTMITKKSNVFPNQFNLFHEWKFGTLNIRSGKAKLEGYKRSGTSQSHFLYTPRGPPP